MADRAPSVSSRLSSTVPVYSNSSQMETFPTKQVALVTLMLNASPPGTSNQNGSLISLVVKGMKIIQEQAQTIEAQAKQLQEQESQIEKLRAELKNVQIKQEQSPKKEAKPPAAVNTTSTNYSPSGKTGTGWGLDSIDRH